MSLSWSSLRARGIVEALRHRTTTSCTDHMILKQRISKIVRIISDSTDECHRDKAGTRSIVLVHNAIPFPNLPDPVDESQNNHSLFCDAPKRLATYTHVILSMPHTQALAGRCALSVSGASAGVVVPASSRTGATS
jgi:hypothetical protein